MVGNEHVSERFLRLLAPTGSPTARSGAGRPSRTPPAVKRSYVSHLKKGRIVSHSLDKMETIARAMGFPPALWFDSRGDKPSDPAMIAALGDETVRSLVEVAARLGPKDRRLLLGIARQISPPRGDD